MKQEPRGSSHDLEVNLDSYEEYMKDKGKNIKMHPWLNLVILVNIACSLYIMVDLG